MRSVFNEIKTIKRNNFYFIMRFIQKNNNFITKTTTLNPKPLKVDNFTSILLYLIFAELNRK